MGRTNPPLAAPVLLSLALAAAFAIAADGGPVALAAWFQAATGPRFYPDDPVWVDDDRAFDASKAKATATGDIYDFVEHTFLPPGERRRSAGAQRQHARRGARLELVHQPHRAAAAVARGAGARARSPRPARHPGLADRRRQGRGRAARLSRPGPGEAPLADRVRSAGAPRDGLRRRGDRHGDLSRARLPRRRGLRRRRRSGEDPDRAQRADPCRDGAQAASARSCRRTSTRCWPAPRAVPTAASASSPAASPRDRRSAASATTGSAPTIPTTSSRTSTGASCAPTASSPPG